MKILALTLTVIGAMYLTPGSFACDLPQSVSIPDGATASEGDMIKGSDAVKQFMADTNRYLACLDAESDNTRATVKLASRDANLQRENQMSQQHNAAVEEMEKVATAFNQAVEEFESRRK